MKNFISRVLNALKSKKVFIPVIVIVALVLTNISVLVIFLNSNSNVPIERETGSITSVSSQSIPSDESSSRTILEDILDDLGNTAVPESSASASWKNSFSSSVSSAAPTPQSENSSEKMLKLLNQVQALENQAFSKKMELDIAKDAMENYVSQWSAATQEAEVILATSEEDARQAYIKVQKAERDAPQLGAAGYENLKQAKSEYNALLSRIDGAKQTIIEQGDYYSPLCEKQQQKIDKLNQEIKSLNDQIQSLRTQINNL